MQIGVVFPQTEIGNDPAAIRDYAQAVEAMGYTHILAYDHVLGASTVNRPDWSGPYTSETPFHEVFVLFSYLAAVTQRVGLVTGVLILPQRQTALVAKQAASLDVLSGGRFRLGVGVGWNAVEYEGLNENFNNRGARSTEQIRVLRALLSDPVVTFKGDYHQITEAGINPLPVQKHLPIWIGGDADAVLRRIGELGDGWFPQQPPDDAARAAIARIHEVARGVRRDPASIGIEPRLNISRVAESEYTGFIEQWRGLGATHLSISTMGVGLASPQAHIDRLQQIKTRLGV
jgi:probable F420-dependent oxidoreductase